MHFIKPKLWVEIATVGLWATSAIVSGKPATAQIVPDRTLPINSQVILRGNTTLIQGGTQAGGNLFHSFSQFSVPTGGTAFFNNDLTVQNIFSRVTGGMLSNIDGILKANGTANLFLLNPNGIIFGKNARLDLGGSFLGTTANSIRFSDGTTYPAVPASTSVLTIDVPIGLQFASNPGSIQVVGNGRDTTVTLSILPIQKGQFNGLSVKPGKTLALIGGDVFLSGGILSTYNGFLEIDSVGSGNVNLNFTPSAFTLGYPSDTTFKDIALSQKSLAVDIGGGNIQFQGKNISLTDGSLAVVETLSSAQSGTLSVNASEAIKISNTANDPRRTGLYTDTNGGREGKGADIIINTSNLNAGNGTISTFTEGGADSGDITINAYNSLEASDNSAINNSGGRVLSTSTQGPGNAGNIQINTNYLTLKNGINLASLSGPGNTGNTGDVIINATKQIELIGINPFTEAPSLFGSSSFGIGNSGVLIVNTSRLMLRDGARITTAIFASGRAGDVMVNASSEIDISGYTGTNLSFIASSAEINSPLYQRVFGVPPIPSGQSGNVTINTPQLRITNGALIKVNNDGPNRGGNININADSVFFDNAGGITASAASGTGGNISLSARDLQLRNNSQITATAGGAGNGGNIALNTDTLVSLENSSITANALGGRGGTIQITAQGVFRSPDSPITATSAAGSQFNGVVRINELEYDVKNTLTPFQGNFVAPLQALADSCLTRRNKERGRFVVTGTGGLPLNPYSTISEYPYLSAPPSPPSVPPTPTPTPSSSPSSWKIGDPIVEANAIEKQPDGRVLLVNRPTDPENAQKLACQQQD